MEREEVGAGERDAALGAIEESRVGDGAAAIGVAGEGDDVPGLRRRACRRVVIRQRRAARLAQGLGIDETPAGRVDPVLILPGDGAEARAARGSGVDEAHPQIQDMTGVGRGGADQSRAQEDQREGDGSHSRHTSRRSKASA